MWNRRRPAPAASLALTLVVVAMLAVPGAASAATVESVVAAATSNWGMTCAPPASGEIQCNSDAEPGWDLTVRPESGPELELYQFAQTSETPLEVNDPEAIDWMIDLQTLACGDPAGVAAYVQVVVNLTKAADVPSEIVGNCTMYGALNGGSLSPFVYFVGSNVLPPPSNLPTASPTPAPPSPTPGPTPTPVVSATPLPSESPSASPGPSFPVSPASLGPSDSPGTSVVAGATPPAVTIEPDTSASPAPTPVPGGGDDQAGGASGPVFAASVIGVTEVNTDIGAFIGSLVLALLMLLFVGFAGELFNNTIENNYDAWSGWLRRGPLGWITRSAGWLAARAGVGVLAFIALTALVSAFVDPGFGPSLAGLAEFLGFFVGLIVVLASFKLPPMLAHRRATGDLGTLRPLPWALVVAIVFVVVSRIADLQPGYLYAIVLGAAFATDVSDRQEGRESFYGAVWTLAAAVLAWLGLTWLRGLDVPADGFGTILLSTAFAAVVVGGLEATAFGLMPMRFMPGFGVYRWNRVAWAVTWGLSIVAFVHLLIGPTSGYVSELSPEAFAAACGVFVVFGALSLGTWAYFRFRRAPTPSSPSGA